MIRIHHCAAVALLLAAVPHGPAAPRGAAATVATDTIAELRALRARALETHDVQLALAAFQRVRGTATHEQLATVFALERVMRVNGEAAVADTVVLVACQALCGEISDDAPALHAALATELGDAPAAGRPVRAAVRALLAHALRPHVTDELVLALQLPLGMEAAVAAAADAVLAAGDAALAAALWHALAYAQLPERQYAGGAADADRAIDAARRALELRRRAGDATAEARTLSLLALAMLRRAAPGQADSAALNIDAAIRLAAGADAPLRAQLVRRSAVIAAVRGDAGTAERLLEEAVALVDAGDAPSRAWHRALVARELAAAGAGEAALRQSRHALAVLATAGLPPVLLARAYVIHGEAHRTQADSDSAAHFFEHAAQALVRAGDEARAAATLTAGAEHHFERARFDEAELLLQAAAETIALWPADGAGERARVLNSLGMLQLARGEWDDAAQAFTTARSMAPIDHAEWYEAERHSTLLAAARGQEPQTGALSATWRNVPGSRYTDPPRASNRPLTQGLTHLFSATVALERGLLPVGELESARALLHRAGHAPSVQRLHGAYAQLFAQLGRADSARARLRLAGELAPHVALPATGDVFGPSDALRTQVRTLPPADAERALRALLAAARAARDGLAEARALEVLGYWHYRVRRPADARTATAYYDSAATKLSTTPLHQLDDWIRVQLGEQLTRLREEAVLAWFARAAELGTEDAAYGALAAAEQGRSLAFEWLAGMRAGLLAAITDPFELNRAAGLPGIGRALYDVPFEYIGLDTPPRAVLSYLVTSDTLVAWLRVGDPRGTPALHVARRAIPADSVGVLVGALRSALGVDADGTRSLDDLEPNPLAARLARGAVRPLDAALRAVTALLLPDELAALLPTDSELIVVPYGALATVPFAALPVGQAHSPLGHDHRIRYAPSLGALHWALRTADGRDRRPIVSAYSDDAARAAYAAWRARAVVVGDPLMPSVAAANGEPVRLAALPGARAEADTIARLLGVQPLTGAAATLAAIQSRAEHATVVHFATHGFAYGTEEKVGDSFVALAPGTGHDGLLTVEQLLAHQALRLSHADLVVLSACQTGLGQLTASEGTLGLQRAFLAAGARSALVSLWNVSDQATALLITSFYRHWLGLEPDPADTAAHDAWARFGGTREGTSKAEALRRAQAELRAVPAFEHPRYWAAFQLVGAE